MARFRGFKKQYAGAAGTPAQLYKTDRATVAIKEGDKGCETVTAGVCDQNGLNVGDLVQDDKLSYVANDVNGEPQLVLIPYEIDSNPFGGNVLIEGGAGVFPLPFIKDQRSVRFAF